MVLRTMILHVVEFVRRYVGIHLTVQWNQTESGVNVLRFGVEYGRGIGDIK